jgi:DNA-binding MarR family transcriptional regulator
MSEPIVASAGTLPPTDDDLIRAMEAIIPRYLRALRRAIERAEGPGRLTMAQVRCLQAIAASPNGETLTSRLARHMSVSAPSISSMIDGLVERALVERKPNPVNRRQVRLLMTAGGRELLHRYNDEITNHLDDLFAPLSARGKRRLFHAVTDLAELLDAHDAAVEIQAETRN